MRFATARKEILKEIYRHKKKNRSSILRSSKSYFTGQPNSLQTIASETNWCTRSAYNCRSCQAIRERGFSQLERCIYLKFLDKMCVRTIIKTTYCRSSKTELTIS